MGSTGSIGTQTLEVVDANPGLFEVVLLSARRNADLLIAQARRYQPDMVIITDHQYYTPVKEALADLPIKVFAGEDSLVQAMRNDNLDMVVTAMVGFSGLKPTIEAIKYHKQIALANKETLVVAGDIINQLLKDSRATIIPVDSEHSAIFQCLQGEFHNPVEKLILTASGGPCRGMTAAQLKDITPEIALKHPNWSMGAKITIDSATLMNKGLEVIEARWLFGTPAEQIEVVVHPQSIIHSLVQFKDGSIKAQMGMPDMRLPIQYALGYPKRLPHAHTQFSFTDYPALTFEAPDRVSFPCLDLAFEALKKGGNMPCILNAANEIAVEAFLNKRIRFTEIPDLINQTMNQVDFIGNPTLEDLYATDKEAREADSFWS